MNNNSVSTRVVNKTINSDTYHTVQSDDTNIAMYQTNDFVQIGEPVERVISYLQQQLTSQYTVTSTS